MNMDINDEYKYEEKGNDDDENYKIQTKMCNRLSKEFGIEDFSYNEIIECKPPEKYGLLNSDVIIPTYYQLHKHPSKILNLDFYQIIKDSIRNYRKLNAYQLTYVKNLKEDYKYEIIELLNQSFGNLIELLENN
jgi:hypothetical protein